MKYTIFIPLDCTFFQKVEMKTAAQEMDTTSLLSASTCMETPCKVGNDGGNGTSKRQHHLLMVFFGAKETTSLVL